MATSQFGYTEPFGPLPSYLNVTKQENGSNIVTVRGADGQSAQINVPPEELDKLADFIKGK